MKKIVEGLYRCHADLNLLELKKSCEKIYEKIKNLPLDDDWYDNDGQPNAPDTTKSLSRYNILTFPLPQIHELYETIKYSFYQVEKDCYGLNLNCNYFIQAWLNYYTKGQFIDWHGHHYKTSYAWHGFFCVDSMPCVTTYKFIDNNLVEVESIDNTLLIGLSENNQHKSGVWSDASRHRITIAFDIVREKSLKNVQNNHWIPI